MRTAAVVAFVASLLAAPGVPAAPKTSCQLSVHNKTPFRVLVHVDGAYWGWVNAREDFTFTGVPKGEIVVYATTQYNEFFWGPRPLKCDQQASWDVVF